MRTSLFLLGLSVFALSFFVNSSFAQTRTLATHPDGCATLKVRETSYGYDVSLSKSSCCYTYYFIGTWLFQDVNGNKYYLVDILKAGKSTYKEYYDIMDYKQEGMYHENHKRYGQALIDNSSRRNLLIDGTMSSRYKSLADNGKLCDKRHEAESTHRYAEEYECEYILSSNTIMELKISDNSSGRNDVPTGITKSVHLSEEILNIIKANNLSLTFERLSISKNWESEPICKCLGYESCEDKERAERAEQRKKDDLKRKEDMAGLPFYLERRGILLDDTTKAMMQDAYQSEKIVIIMTMGGNIKQRLEDDLRPEALNPVLEYATVIVYNMASDIGRDMAIRLSSYDYNKGNNLLLGFAPGIGFVGTKKYLSSGSLNYFESICNGFKEAAEESGYYNR